MKASFFKRWKFWRRLLLWLIVVPTLLFFTLILIVYWKQDAIVQELISRLNEDFTGEIEIEDSHVSPFENFPYISINLDNVKIFEDKENHKDSILEVEDVYVGFDLWSLVAGNYDIKVIELKNGYIHAVQREDGELNIAKALSSPKPVEEIEEDFKIHLKAIELINIDIYKFNESNGLMVEAFVDHADLAFKTNDEHVLASIDSRMEVNVISNGDTSFFKHKHLNISSEIEYLKESQLILISPSELELESVTLTAEGMIDVADDFNVEMSLYGHKKNFDLFMALAPEELHPVLDAYDNAGEIEFDLTISGKVINGSTPKIYAGFSCKNAHFENKISHKKIDNLNFSGHFSNNGKPGLEEMEFSLNDFTASPEAGIFEVNLEVKNFESPDIDLTLDSDFDLDFLTSFINATSFDDLHGKIKMHMKFHDIIDLTHPERSIERLNEAYYSEILIEDLGFATPAYHLPLKNFNTKITIEGHQATIEYFRAELGGSDINISGHISDLPAILHHTSDEVTADLLISSTLLDLKELTDTKEPDSEPIDEKIDNLKMNFKFVSLAKNFTDSPNLPVGEFFIEDLYAKLERYPHVFHDFHADVFIEDSNFRIVDFSGMIDQSDFHFLGKLYNYERWFEKHPFGDTKIDFDLSSDHLELDDLFSYKGENYVPDDYRHEELSNLKLHGSVDLHFNDGLQSTDASLTQLNAKMKIHPLKLENFNGKIHFESEHLVIEKLYGKIGKSSFTVDLNYYMGDDEAVKKRDNHFGIQAARLDFDELFNYHSKPTDLSKSPDEHEAVFNIYDLPFTTMTFDIDIANLNYQRYLMKNFKAKLNTTPNHYIYIDTLTTNAAGGSIALSGYFNGSDKDQIYFSPNMKLKNVNLDQLLFKFENFGQDHLVSENVHGRITATLRGTIHVHADMVPILDDSEISMDVLIENGRLENFAPIVDMREYFVDKNVNNVKFDTLQNHIDFTNGNITITNMTINSTLGFIMVSGTQDMAGNMEYYIRVPLKLVAGTGFKTLFGKNKEEISPDQEDEIEYIDADKKRAYVNIKIVGNEDDYEVSLGKDKKSKN